MSGSPRATIAAALKEEGYEVTVSDTLDSYLDESCWPETDLIVQCWTMGDHRRPGRPG